MENGETLSSPSTPTSGSDKNKNKLLTPPINISKSSDSTTTPRPSIDSNRQHEHLPQILLSSSSSSFSQPSSSQAPGLSPSSSVQFLEHQNLMKLKLLGVTDDEMKRWSALKKLGVTDEDFAIGAQYAALTSVLDSQKLQDGDYSLTKVEKLTGYTNKQQKRSKAIKTLGTTEEEISEIRSKVLGQIGLEPHGTVIKEQYLLTQQTPHQTFTSPTNEIPSSSTSSSGINQFPKLKRWSSL